MTSAKAGIPSLQLKLVNLQVVLVCHSSRLKRQNGNAKKWPSMRIKAISW